MESADVRGQEDNLGEQPGTAPGTPSQGQNQTSTADIAGRPEGDMGSSTNGASDGLPDGQPALLAEDDARGLQTSWEAIQVTFVDRPRAAVADADALVADVMQRVARSFADERASLETRWNAGDDVSTEDLRQTLQRYRSFFQRLLTV